MATTVTSMKQSISVLVSKQPVALPSSGPCQLP